MNWPEEYYRHLDGDERWSVMKQHIEETGSSAETDVLTEIWKARYQRDKKTAMLLDTFVKSWLDLAVVSRKSPIFGIAGKKRVVEKAAQTLLLDRYQDADELTRRLLDAEYEHLFRMIIHLECTDSGFNHHVLGISKLGNDALQRKISGQLVRVLRELPGKYQCEVLFAPLESAGVRAFAASFEGEPVL